MKIGGINGTNNYYMKIGGINVSIRTPIFIYDLLIGAINVSDVHIVVFFNDYYILIVAFLMKQIQNRYRYRRLPDSLHTDRENLIF